MPWIIRTLRVVDDGAGQHQELHARAATDAAAAARIEQLAVDWPTHLPLIDTLRAQYTHRASHGHNAEHAADDESAHERLGDEAAEQELFEHRLIRRAVIDAERAAVLDLRRRGEINDEAWRRIERDLDLEELRMEA